MLEYGLSFVAGILTALSPCVLPALPLIVGSAAQEHRGGPIAVAAGMVGSFTVLGAMLVSIEAAFGLEATTVRTVAAVFIVLSGALLISSALQERIMPLSSPITRAANRILAQSAFSGLKGQFFLGALLGAVWSPCVGPTLGAAIGLAAQGEHLTNVMTTMLLFGLGAALPLLAVAYTSRRAFGAWRGGLTRFAGAAKPAFGLILVVIGGSVLLGFDKVAESWVLDQLPASWLDLTTRY